MTLDEIKKLADMARVDMSQEELQGLAGSFDSILSYVSQIKEVSGDLNTERVQDELIPFNVMREDKITNERGSYSQKIIDEFPDKDNNYLKVKQIL